MSINQPHIPVLLNEVIEVLEPVSGKLIIDGTFGAGGYSRKFLERGAKVIAFDQDPNIVPTANLLKKEWGRAFEFFHDKFSNISRLEGEKIDAIVLDIGVSSIQLDEAKRGFSFMRDGPLDMRMSAKGQTAAQLINNIDEKRLADILFAYGEEKKSKKIAKAIIKARKEKPILRTKQLADIIEQTIGRRKNKNIHPATKSFQAIRIAVNYEFDELIAGLFAAEKILPAGGILAVISFHSLEDRIVKKFFASGAKKKPISRHLPPSEENPPVWHKLTKPIKVSEEELIANPRSRSAKLRFATRTKAKARAPFLAGLGVPLSRGKEE